MNQIAIHLAVEWAFDSKKGRSYITTNGSVWDVLCSSVANFLEQDYHVIRDEMVKVAESMYGPDWHTLWVEATGKMELDDILPKQFGGKELGIRDMSGVWEFLIRQQKKGVLTNA